MPPAEQLPEGTDAIIEGAGVGEDDDKDLGAPAEADAESDEAALSSGFVPKDDKASSAPSDNDGPSDFRSALFGRVDELRGQGADSARNFAMAGKDRAVSALDDLVRMVEEAATEVDGRLGSQYGDYARRAADGLGSFSESFKEKDVDELFADARALLTKSPAIAIGTAAALGFVVARLVRAGIDAGTATATGKDANAA